MCDSQVFPGAIEDVLWARRHAAPAPHRELDDWLSTLAFDFFEQCYDHGAATISHMPPFAAFRRAEADYSRWISQNAPVMLARVYDREPCSKDDDCVPWSSRWPGFDAFGAGLAILDRWERSGHGADPLLNLVVCGTTPHVDASGRKPCPWFQHAAQDAITRPLLARALGGYDDPAPVRGFASSSTRAGAERVVALWTALEPWPHMWRALGLTATETLMRDPEVRGPFFEEAERAYAVAEHRDVALYMFALYAVPGRWSWDRFTREHGGPVGMNLFAKFLDVSPRSLDVVPKVWPALANKDGSRVGPVLERLDAYLDRRAASKDTLRSIVWTVCKHGTTREKGDMSRWLTRRAKEGGALGDELGSLARCANSPHCGDALPGW